MKSNLKLVDGPRTPQREELAEAIARHKEATQRLAKLKQALDDLPLYGAGGAAGAETAAETALEVAKANEAAHLAAIALGEIAEAENPVTIAEAALKRAQDRVAALRKTRDALKQQVETAESEVKYTKDGVNKFIRAVLQDEGAAFIDAALKEAADLRSQLSAKWALLSFMRNACFSGDRELSRPISDFMAAPPIDYQGDKHPAIEPWRSAVAALAVDADAALPI